MINPHQPAIDPAPHDFPMIVGLKNRP